MCVCVRGGGWGLTLPGSFLSEEVEEAQPPAQQRGSFVRADGGSPTARRPGECAAASLHHCVDQQPHSQFSVMEAKSLQTPALLHPCLLSYGSLHY